MRITGGPDKGFHWVVGVIRYTDIHKAPGLKPVQSRCSLNVRLLSPTPPTCSLILKPLHLLKPATQLFVIHGYAINGF